jgi:Cytochrome P460
MKPVALFALALSLMVGSELLLADKTPAHADLVTISLPPDYESWRHVKTQIIQEGPGFERFGGMHHIYANERALQGLRSRRFEEGATLVAEFRTLARQDNVIDAGAIRMVDVMVFDPRRFADTDGWGYAEFVGPELKVRRFDSRAECHACHAKRADRGHVFTELRAR